MGALTRECSQVWVHLPGNVARYRCTYQGMWPGMGALTWECSQVWVHLPGNVARYGCTYQGMWPGIGALTRECGQGKVHITTGLHSEDQVVLRGDTYRGLDVTVVCTSHKSGGKACKQTYPHYLLL